MPGLLDNFPAMTGLGIGLLQSAAARRGLGAGLGQGLLYAQQFGADAMRQQAYQQAADREQQRFDWERQQAEAERRAEDEQRAAMTRFTANLPAETREMLNAGGMPALQAYVANQIKPPTPHSEVAQIQADLASGLMTPEQAQAAINKATYIAPQAPRDDPLVAVYDPNSPTGTSMIPRSQAAGMPGKPSSGMEVGYDDQGRLMVRTGVPSVGRGEVGKPPAGFRPTADGQSLEPIPGGPAERKLAEDRQTQLTELADARNTFNTLRGLVQERGVEILPSASKGEMASQYGFARAALTKLLNTGVLQPGELPVLEQILQDPTSMGRIPAALIGQATPQVLAQLDTIMAKLDERANTLKQNLPALSGQPEPQVGPAPAFTPPPPPAVGEVRGGYRFKGGEPADPNSWEPAGG